MSRQEPTKVFEGPHCDGPEECQRQAQGCPPQHCPAELHVHNVEGDTIIATYLPWFHFSWKSYFNL